MTKSEFLQYSFLPFFLEEPIYLIKEKPIIPFLGENKANIVILVHFLNGDFLKSNEFDMLLRILNAVKLSQHEVAIVNMAVLEKDITFQHIRRVLSPQKMIIFGSNVQEFLFNKALSLYQIHDVEGTSVVVVDSLTTLLKEDNPQRPKAKALWAILQKFI